MSRVRRCARELLTPALSSIGGEGGRLNSRRLLTVAEAGHHPATHKCAARGRLLGFGSEDSSQPLAPHAPGYKRTYATATNQVERDQLNVCNRSL
jgi:hypothetical protein